MIQSIKKIRLNILSLTLLMLLFLVSCQKEEATLIDVENFTDSSIENLQSKVVGINHCLEFVFPIEIEFIDGSSAEVTDYENLNETIKAWFTNNEVEKSKENKPSLIFPLEVVTQDGDVVMVSDVDELKALKSDCPRNGNGKKGKKGRGFHCFELVFPVTLIIEGETLSFASKAELKEAIKAFKEEADENSTRPELVFPITIEYKDETQIEVTSKEELSELKEDCKDN